MSEQQQAKMPYMEIKLNIIATLKALRRKAEIENLHQVSRTWEEAIAMIDIAIDDMEQL